MADAPSSILDAHVHLWDTSRFELAWLANVPELSGRYTADDLQATIGGLPIRRAVAVQAGESAEEASWLLTEVSLSEHGAIPLGVVLQYAPLTGRWLGAVQPVVDRGGALPDGVRVPVHRRAPDWTDLDGFEALVTGLEEQGIVLELLLRPDQLAAVNDIAARHPGLDIVLCHLGLGAASPTPEWRAALSRLSARPNVAAKVSGLFSPLGVNDDGDAGVRSAVATAADALGPERLMFGSDWPMSTRVGSYAEIVERTAHALPNLAPAEATAIWATTAERLYGDGGGS